MEIIKYPNDILRQVSSEVSIPLSEEDKSVLNNLFSYVKSHKDTAVGLSAIQVGIPKRMCAVRITRKGETKAYKLVNPKIVSHSPKKVYDTEGCLSIAEGTDTVYKSNLVGRWESVRVYAFDLITNKYVTILAAGFEARVLQHEIDHMDGKLYIDYLK